MLLVDDSLTDEEKEKIFNAARQYQTILGKWKTYPLITGEFLARCKEKIGIKEKEKFYQEETIIVTEEVKVTPKFSGKLKAAELKEFLKKNKLRTVEIDEITKDMGKVWVFDQHKFETGYIPFKIISAGVSYEPTEAANVYTMPLDPIVELSPNGRYLTPTECKVLWIVDNLEPEYFGRVKTEQPWYPIYDYLYGSGL